MLWAMFQEEKDTRISGNVEYATKNYNLVLEKRDLEKKVYDLQKQLGNTMALQQVHMVTTGELELQKTMRERAELKVCTLKEEKRNLEFYLADLLKFGESNKQKLKKIADILSEE
jgi:hypothetical protein